MCKSDVHDSQGSSRRRVDCPPPSWVAIICGVDDSRKKVRLPPFARSSSVAGEKKATVTIQVAWGAYTFDYLRETKTKGESAPAATVALTQALITTALDPLRQGVFEQKVLCFRQPSWAHFKAVPQTRRLSTRNTSSWREYPQKEGNRPCPGNRSDQQSWNCELPLGSGRTMAFNIG